MAIVFADESVSRTPAGTPPERIIAFVGATSSGKSSTLNALLGRTAFVAGQEHGTTTEMAEQPFTHGYRLRDTPGLLDCVDHSHSIWEALRRASGRLHGDGRALSTRVGDRRTHLPEPGPVGPRSRHTAPPPAWDSTSTSRTFGTPRCLPPRLVRKQRSSASKSRPGSRRPEDRPRNRQPRCPRVRKPPQIDQLHDLVLAHISGPLPATT